MLDICREEKETFWHGVQTFKDFRFLCYGHGQSCKQSTMMIRMLLCYYDVYDYAVSLSFSGSLWFDEEYFNGLIGAII